MNLNDRLGQCLTVVSLISGLCITSPAWAHETYQLRAVGSDDATSIDDQGRVTANDWNPALATVLEGSITTWSQAGAYVSDLGAGDRLVGRMGTDGFVFDAIGLHVLVDAQLDAISDGGMAVGHQWSSGVEAIEWDGTGVPTVLAAPGWPSTTAIDISPNGRYVVGKAYDVASNTAVGVLWDRQTGSSHQLPDAVALVGGGIHQGTWSQATGVNDAGDVVGFIYAGNVGEPVLWTVSSGWTVAQHLGPTLPGMVTCNPTAINDAGLVVGECGALSEAFVWYPGDTSLTPLLDEVDPTSATGWLLVGAYDINDIGQIVGLGWGPAGYEGFVLSPEGACLKACSFPDGTTLQLPDQQCYGLGGEHHRLAGAIACHEHYQPAQHVQF